MKTIKKGKKIVRVADKEADARVKTQGWKYCPKSEWREKVRDARPEVVAKKAPKNKKNKK